MNIPKNATSCNAIGLATEAAGASLNYDDELSEAKPLSEFEQALPDYEPVTCIEPGDKLDGNIVRKIGDGYLVDVGGKDEVFLPLCWSPQATQVGDPVEVLVVHAACETERAQVTRLHSLNGTYQGVLERPVEKGGRAVGFQVRILGNLRAFLPMSELAAPWAATTPRGLVGQAVPVQILPDGLLAGRDPVVSNKVAVKQARALALSQIKTGDVLFATVTAIPKINTGVAVVVHAACPEAGDVLPGFIRRSEVVENGNRPCSEVLSIGDIIEVQVTGIEEGSGKLFLAYRSLVTERYIRNLKIGDVVDAVVVAAVEYGIFVRLGDCVRALLHNTQTRKVNGKRESYTLGQKIKVKVVDVSPDKVRIGVSTKGVDLQVNDGLTDERAAIA